jgi:hypothetical protein
MNKQKNIKVDPPVEKTTALSVEYQGQMIYLNSSLVKEQKLSQQKITKLLKLHFLQAAAKDLMDHVENVKMLPKLAAVIEDLNFQMQELWGFNRDADFHHWYEVPRCTCPKMDNKDRFGTNQRIYSSECPVHNKKLKSTKSF